MSDTQKLPKILSVGQCGADAPQIARLLEKNFQAKVETAHSLEEAFRLATSKEYDLILANRIFDRTGEEGAELIKMIVSAPQKRKIMLVSNHPSAQQQAITHGAFPGFGKDYLGDKKTIVLIQNALDAT